MRSSWLRCLAVPVAVSVLSGCAFTQWTDNAFIGSPDDPPTHANREWAGAVLLPLAITGDIIFAPVQVIVLLVTGDYGIYARSNAPLPKASLLDADGNAVRVASATTVDELSRAVASKAHHGEALAAWSIDAQGNLAEYALSPQQQALLLARASQVRQQAAVARN